MLNPKGTGGLGFGSLTNVGVCIINRPIGFQVHSELYATSKVFDSVPGKFSSRSVGLYNRDTMGNPQHLNSASSDSLAIDFAQVISPLSKLHFLIYMMGKTVLTRTHVRNRDEF